MLGRNAKHIKAKSQREEITKGRRPINVLSAMKTRNAAINIKMNGNATLSRTKEVMVPFFLTLFGHTVLTFSCHRKKCAVCGMGGLGFSKGAVFTRSGQEGCSALFGIPPLKSTYLNLIEQDGQRLFRKHRDRQKKPSGRPSLSPNNYSPLRRPDRLLRQHESRVPQAAWKPQLNLLPFASAWRMRSADSDQRRGDEREPTCRYRSCMSITGKSSGPLWFRSL